MLLKMFGGGSNQSRWGFLAGHFQAHGFQVQYQEQANKSFAMGARVVSPHSIWKYLEGQASRREKLISLREWEQILEIAWQHGVDSQFQPPSQKAQFLYLGRLQSSFPLLVLAIGALKMTLPFRRQHRHLHQEELNLPFQVGAQILRQDYLKGCCC